MLELNNKGGFTLIELMVSVSILILVSALTLVNYPKFIEVVNLKRSVQELALNIRRAQVYGVSVRESTSGKFPAYGIHFGSTKSNKYSLFVDKNGDYQYSAASNEIIYNYFTPTPSFIGQLCGGGDYGEDCNLEFLDIVFIRPAPKIQFVSNLNKDFNYVRVILSSSRGSKKSVEIWKTGQIVIR